MKCRNMVNGRVVWFGRSITYDEYFSQDVWGITRTYEYLSIKPGDQIAITFRFESDIDWLKVMFYRGSQYVEHRLPAVPTPGREQTCIIEVPPDIPGATRNVMHVDIPEGDSIGGWSIHVLKAGVLPNYVDGADAVACSLEQRLSVIKGELWYQINHGLPLFEKHTSKGVFDTAICSIVSSHPAVSAIETYSSSITGHEYKFECKIRTTDNEELSIANSYSV